MSERVRPLARRTPGSVVIAGAVAVLAGTLVAVAPADAATSSVTFTVSGTVTEAGTGAPVAGQCVRAWFTDADCTTYEVSDADGRYQRTFTVVGGKGKSGSLWVVADEFHASSKPSLKITSATEYTADVVLTPVGTLTGRALDSTGAPVVGACPSVRGAAAAVTAAVEPTCSDADGVWTLTKVGAGSVAVALAGTSTLQASYVPTASRLDLAKRYDVVLGARTSLPDTVLQPGGTITVHTDRAGGGSNIITLRPTKRTQDLVVGDRAMTGAESDAGDGINPTLTNVQAGEYFVIVENVDDPADCSDDEAVCSSFAPWWAPGVDDPGKAKPVKITAGGTVELTAAMPSYRKLSLIFPDLPGESDVTVQAYFPSGKAWSVPNDLALTSLSGGVAYYLPPSAVKLKFITELESGRKVWWYGGTNLRSATVVPTSATLLTVKGPGKG